MYAIIKASGQQFKVKEGDIVCFDNMNLEPKSAVEFKEVLVLDNNGAVTIGTPFVEGAVVKGEVINEGRDKKVIIYKKLRRKDSKLKRGFRRDFTRVRITKIA
ncbi:MAG TPA: 50S ribosomal protein L21 [Sulfurovum sp.]|jgi:large subunit ribosomal protein L21|nr:MAG: 50S ribosomal protein L21 [Sulfurovum sp. 35-42-20]OYZ24153.1 MAG: 50S ribosomal protein L21 [Sulfurovum sp. 16-42-52]OYZ47912.1 MAG: 50S ribosomal protein L21 [Sulfurovum sp. 24-42-9]OZA43991.1 MAG: 50S ribosomal protein L21 [Sulfurovum sp. 17-42-90]HQS73494.1 50S ribosomal protein L21 [Sulfurovum sp.]